MTQIPVVDLLGEIRLICRTAPTQVLINAYVRAARRLCDHAKWLTATVTGDTEADRSLYDLGNDVYTEIIGIRALSVIAPAAFVGPLTERGSEAWDPDEPPGRPELYQYVSQAQFALHPTPDQVYSLQSTVVLKPKRDVTSLPDILVQEWDIALQHGALSYLCKIPRQAWTDMQRAGTEESAFVAKCNEAASDVYRRFNAGALSTDRPGPQNASLRVKVLPI